MLLISLLQDVKSHAILDAAGQVEVLGFCIDHALFTPVQEANREQRRVADHVLELFTASWDAARCARANFTIERRSNCHGPSDRRRQRVRHSISPSAIR